MTLSLCHRLVHVVHVLTVSSTFETHSGAPFSVCSASATPSPHILLPSRVGLEILVARCSTLVAERYLALCTPHRLHYFLVFWVAGLLKEVPSYVKKLKSFGDRCWSDLRMSATALHWTGQTRKRTCAVSSLNTVVEKLWKNRECNRRLV